MNQPAKPLDISTALKFYKRREIQEEIVRHAENREAAIQFNGVFGRRPEILHHPTEIIEAVQNGATSFHVSEERWFNPLQLSTALKKTELEQLRSGWDLVLDIDCKVFEYSRIAADLIIKFLRSQGIKSIFAKFSGNKGFHIGVPLEAFPSEINGKDIKSLFPEAARRIAFFIKENIKLPLGERIMEFEHRDLANVKQRTGCGSEIIGYKINQYKDKIPFLDAEKFLEIDTVLISSRHLYRAPYSFNEKSGLISLPLDPEKVSLFEKEMAQPEKIVVSPFGFLERNAEPGEARALFLAAYDFKLPEEKTASKEKSKAAEFLELNNIKIPVEMFPPCIKLIDKGMEDGKKRALFILMQFLRKTGRTEEEVEQYIREWNKRNPEELRETYFLPQLRHSRGQDKLPPNCSNEGYMKAIGVCKPDDFCRKIKNPANYALLKYKIYGQTEKKKKTEAKPKKTEKKEKNPEKIS